MTATGHRQGRHNNQRSDFDRVEEQYLAKYRILGLLGGSNFATVYRCLDPDLQTVCAIKVLAEDWSEDELVRSSFLNEAQAMFEIEHPSLLRVFTTGTLDDGCPYIVMQYADGGSLADFIRSRRVDKEGFSTAEALQISIAIAHGLNVAHSHGLVHRNLKPSNILFLQPLDGSSPQAADDTGHVIKLADLGMSGRLEQGADSSGGAGTPHYIAPEQTRGPDNGLTDVRIDIYAAATILYELLAGQVPFPYSSTTRVIEAHLGEDPVPIQSIAPWVPDEVAQVVHHGLAKDPDQRVQSAASWLYQLQVLRTALNPDGTIAGWDADEFRDGRSTDQHLPPDEEPAYEQITLASPVTAQRPPFNSGLETTLVTRGVGVDRVEPAEHAATPARERSNPMIAYMIGAVMLGVVVVGLLGFALAELAADVDPELPAEQEPPAEVADEDPADEEAPEPVPTSTPDDDNSGQELSPTPAEPTATPEPESEPDPTATPAPEPTAGPEDDPSSEGVALALQQLPGDVSSAVVLPSGETVDESSDREVPAASTINLWIAATALEEIATGDLSFDEDYTVSADDQVPGTGILNDAGNVGRSMSVGEIIETMLRFSDNTAANIILDQVGGIARVNEYAGDHGYPDTRMQRRLGELDSSRENYTSARDGALFLERLISDEIVDETSSDYLRSVLEQRATEDDLDFFGTNLPTGTTYAHMSGILPGVRNEIGYFRDDRRDGYVIVSFMLGGLSNETSGENAIATVVSEIHGHLNAVAQE